MSRETGKKETPEWVSRGPHLATGVQDSFLIGWVEHVLSSYSAEGARKVSFYRQDVIIDGSFGGQ